MEYMVSAMIRINLYTFNFDAGRNNIIKKRIKMIASASLFCVLLIATGKILRYILTDDTKSYTRVTYHEMYEQDNIDVLFVGSSHCYRSFVPEILDEKLGQNTFNAGSSSQFLDGSYMLIKEAVRNNNVKHVYLEIYFGCAFDVKKERTTLTSTYIISDYMRPSFDKYLYLYNATTSDYYANSFIVARRNWRELFDFDYIGEILIKKSSDSYKNYGYSNISDDTEWYAGKGYVANNSAVSNWDFFSTKGYAPIDINSISEDWKNDLDGIISFCEKKDIPLTFIGAPMSNFLLAGNGNYDEYIACVKEVIGDRDVDYYDFNLCKEKYFPNTSKYFKDVDHVNCYGAEAFSNSFARLVNNEVPQGEMFYDSYAEKLENISVTVFGVSYKDETSEDGTVLRNCKIVSNREAGLEYLIKVEPEEGKEYVLRDYSPDVYFHIDPEEKGACVVRYRKTGENGNMGEVNLTLP